MAAVELSSSCRDLGPQFNNCGIVAKLMALKYKIATLRSDRYIQQMKHSISAVTSKMSAINRKAMQNQNQA